LHIRRARLSNSSKAWESRDIPASASSEMPVSNFSANAGFNISVGIMVTRFALPQRSPMPFSVP
jgi:hypothetical protein